MEGESCSEGHGFESQQNLLDGHFSHWFVVNIVLLFVWKRPKLNEKEAGDGPFINEMSSITQKLLGWIGHGFEGIGDELVGKRDMPDQVVAVHRVTQVLKVGLCIQFGILVAFDVAERSDQKCTIFFAATVTRL